MNTRFKIFAIYNILQYLCDFIHVLIFVTVSKCCKSPKLTNIVIHDYFHNSLRRTWLPFQSSWCIILHGTRVELLITKILCLQCPLFISIKHRNCTCFRVISILLFHLWFLGIWSLSDLSGEWSREALQFLRCLCSEIEKLGMVYKVWASLATSYASSVEFVVSWSKWDHTSRSMNGENWSLVTDEPVESENNRLKFKTSGIQKEFRDCTSNYWK